MSSNEARDAVHDAELIAEQRLDVTVAAPEVERLLRLYRERYQGFNVRHFHQIARREHGVTVSDSFLKHTLQAAGLVKKHRAGARAAPSPARATRMHWRAAASRWQRAHEWFTLAPEVRPCLIAVSDDATKRVLQATFYPSESRQAVYLAERFVAAAQRGVRAGATRSGECLRGTRSDRSRP